MKMIRIEILDGPEQGVDHSFREEKLRFGSSTENNVQLSGEGVLPSHALMELEGNQGKLIPAREDAVILVNGRQIEGPCLLQPQDIIHLGSQSFRYKLIPYPQPLRTRKAGLLVWMTLGSLALVACSQLYFLFGTSRSLRHEVRQDLLRPEPTPLATPEPVETLIPEEPTPEPESQIILPTPIPTALPLLLPTPTPVPDTAGMALDDLIRLARERMGQGNELEAERLLMAVLQRDPEYLPAKIDLARMLGRQSSYDRSIAIWEEVLAEAPAGSMDAADARIELQTMRNRKARLEAVVPTPPPIMPTPRAPQFIPTPDTLPDVRDPIAPAVPQVDVTNIRMERFPESPRYDHFRMIYFNLTHRPGTPAVEPGAIQVVVNFFEQQGEKVGPAQIPEPRIQIKVAQGLSGNKSTEQLSAAYDVPSGKGNPSRSYYGVVIQVFIDGKEVNRAADPSFLLDFIR
jgi:hypothetical protein